MKDGIILFLKENIIGRNLFTEDVVYKLETGNWKAYIATE